MPVLKVDNLTKAYTAGLWPFKKAESYVAVKGISFEVKQGEIVGFLGPNGAGKTTTIQMLLGVLTPTSGTISYFGTTFACHRIASLKRIGYASGYDRLPARLTVWENLDIVGRVYGLDAHTRSEQIERLLSFFGIAHMRNRQVGTLSAGQATRVMLVKAFIADPDLVLLDEPTASLDPDVAYEVRQFVLQQSQRNRTSILITSHNMEEVTQLCDRVIVLKHGEIIANNTPEQLIRSTSCVRVQLTFAVGLEQAIQYVQARGVRFAVQHEALAIELDEHAIAPFLLELGTHGIIYSHIAINKPTLEDYFLSIAK